MRTAFKTSAIAILVAMLAVAPASALTLNLGGSGSGGLLNIGGSNTDPSVDVLTNGTVAGAPSGTATTNALNTGGSPTTADVTLGGMGAGNPNANVLLDLFGSGDDGTAAVALGSGNGADGGAALDLFGNGGGTGGAGPGSGGTNDDLFGPAGGTGNSGSGGLVGNGIRVASLDSVNTRCFAPNAMQISRLANRHDYDQVPLSSWATASSISIVSTGLCDSAKTTIAGDANVARLQAFVNGNAAIKSTLAQQGRSASDVIAIDKKGDTLVVYVG